jgi:hypothetical protein
MNIAQAESNLARYGRAMLESLPDETTQLLIDLCTTSGTLILDAEETPVVKQMTNTGPSYLSYLALNRNSLAPPTISSDTATPTPASIKTVKPGDTASRRDSDPDDSPPSTPPPPATAPVKPRTTVVKKLSPRLYFAHFVDHMDYFVVFLETVALRRWGQSVSDHVLPPPAPTEAPADEEADKRDQVAVWNTLLELYLTLPVPGADQERAIQEKNTLREKVLRLLKSDDIPYDPTHALILCSSRDYMPGLVLLWEKMGMHEDVLRFWMDRDKEGTSPDASSQVVHYLKLYGATRPHLYPLVLRFLTSTPELLTKHTEDIAVVLEYINQGKILPPLGVIQVLSRNGVASVGLVKKWLMTRIEESRNEISAVNDFLSSRKSWSMLIHHRLRTNN